MPGVAKTPVQNATTNTTANGASRGTGAARSGGRRMAIFDHLQGWGRQFCPSGGHFLAKIGDFRLGTAIPRQMVSIPDGAGWIPNAAVWIPEGWVWLPRAAVWIPDEMVGLPKAAVFIPPRLGWHPKGRGMATISAGIDPAPSGRKPGRAGIESAAKGNGVPLATAAGRARCPQRAAPGCSLGACHGRNLLPSVLNPERIRINQPSVAPPGRYAGSAI